MFAAERVSCAAGEGVGAVGQTSLSCPLPLNLQLLHSSVLCRLEPRLGAQCSRCHAGSSGLLHRTTRQRGE